MRKRSRELGRVLAAIVSCAASLLVVPIAGAEGRFTTTDDGVKIYYEAVGTGVPMFMIAGGPGADSSRFRYTHTLLQPCGRLVFLDNRGRGRSDDAPRSADGSGRYSLEDDLRDVETVRNALGAERIVIYGHSYGSMVAMAYAGRFPKHTLALITTAGVHGARVWQHRNITGVKRFLQNHFPKRWAKIVALHDAGELTGEGELAQLFQGIEELYFYQPDSERRLHDQLEDFHDPKAVRFDRDVYRAIVGDDPEWTLGGTLKGVELLPQLSNYKGPALIMGGRYDRICPPINQVEIAGALENARLVIFEKSGHAPFKEEPLRFLAVVSEFLREVTKPRQSSSIPPADR